MRLLSTSQSIRAYSLIELTVSIGVLVAGISAAASLAMNTAQMEDINYRKARVLAITEGAARLWQLGLSPTNARALLLGDPALSSLTINDEVGDPTSAVPTDKGTAIGDPTTDLGSFDRGTVRATVLSFPGGPNGANAVTASLSPVVVLR